LSGANSFRAWIEWLANMIADERAEPFASLACLGRHGIKRTELGVRAKMCRHVCGHGVSLFQPGDEAAAVPEPLDLLPQRGDTVEKIEREIIAEIQLDLFGNYRSNVALYPKFQEYIRSWRPPLLAVWGKNDPFFLPAGAEAFRRDNPDAEIHLLDAGHFALESQGPEIAATIRRPCRVRLDA
jgi:pimeloyl-ACP methyl ester carboxylesterase